MTIVLFRKDYTCGARANIELEKDCRLYNLVVSNRYGQTMKHSYHVTIANAKRAGDRCIQASGEDHSGKWEVVK